MAAMSLLQALLRANGGPRSRALRTKTAAASGLALTLAAAVEDAR
jgi:hypothetical protein